MSIAVIGALSLTACGSRDDKKSGDSGQAGSSTTVTIGVDAPLTGDLSALGLGIRNSVELAVKQANEKNEVPGVKFQIKGLDDTGKPAPGQQNATQLVGDKDVIGVVGPLNSSVAQSMQQIFNDANLVQISPANTGVALSQGEKWASGVKARPFKSYFRTATTDAVQGPFAADYLIKDAKKTKVFLIDDQKTYGAASPPPSRASSSRTAARSWARSTSTPTTATSPPSSPRSSPPAPKRSTTAASTPPPARSRSSSRTPASTSR